MLAVVGIHAQKGVLYLSGGETPAAALIFLIVCNHLFQAAVPLYFAISGFLLFLRHDGPPDDYPKLVSRRFRSLFLPFLLVNGFWLAYLSATGAIPGIGGSTYLKTRGYLQLLLGLDGLPLIYPLWFLRDLFVLFVLSPVLGWLLRHAAYAGLALLWLCWNFLPQGDVPVAYLGVFFFYLGGLAAVKRFPLACPGPALAALWTGFALLTALSVFILTANPGSVWWFPVWRLCVLTGTLAVWYWSGWAKLQDWGWLTRIAPFIFFVYLVHEPALSYLADACSGLFSLPGTISQLGFALGLAVAATAVSLALALLLRSLAPPVYRLLTGGR